MDDMKDSGIPWLGEIPAEWEIEKFKYNLKRSSDLKNGDVQVLSLYREFGIVPKDSRDDNHNVTSEDTSKYRMVRPGDFVVNKMKAWQGSVAVSNYKGIVSPAYYVFHFYNYHLDKKYFHFLMRSNYKDEFKRLSGGIREGQWDLPAYDLGNVKIILPPENEQQQIVTFLDKKCREIDGIVAKIQQEMETLKQYKQSVISEAVTKGIRPNVPMKDSGVASIGIIPKTWEKYKIKYVTKIIRGGSPRPIEKFMSDSDKGYNWIKIGDTNKNNRYISHVSSKIIPEGLSKTRLVKAGTLLLTNSMSFGEPYILNVEGCIHDGWVAFFDYQNIDKIFLYYCLISSGCRQQFEVISDGGVVQNLNIDKIGNTYLALPNLSEQREIAAYLDQKCAAIDTIISSKEEQLQTLSSYKKSLIYEYVTGKKRVPTA